MASEEELKAEIEKLRAENESLKKPARGQVSLKVSEKGGLSVYGLGRFPVTLYREQWEKLLGMTDEIRTFIRENDGALKKKEWMAPRLDSTTKRRRRPKNLHHSGAPDEVGRDSLATASSIHLRAFLG
jgi:hypothetical protein